MVRHNSVVLAQVVPEPKVPVVFPRNDMGFMILVSAAHEVRVNLGDILANRKGWNQQLDNELRSLGFGGPESVTKQDLQGVVTKLWGDEIWQQASKKPELTMSHVIKYPEFR